MSNTEQRLHAALGQASFALRMLLPNDPDAQMTVRMIDAALPAALETAADDAFERGRQQGRSQERALWELSRLGQEIEAGEADKGASGSGDGVIRCPEKLKPGGCQLHNLHCGWPICNEPEAAQPAEEPATGMSEADLRTNIKAHFGSTEAEADAWMQRIRAALRTAAQPEHAPQDTEADEATTFMGLAPDVRRAMWKVAMTPPSGSESPMSGSGS